MDFFNKSSIFTHIRNIFIAALLIFVGTIIITQFVDIPFATLAEIVTVTVVVMMLIPGLIHQLEILLIERLNQPRLAIRVCNLMLLCNRRDKWSYLNRSWAYLVLEEFQEAVKSCDSALLYDPEMVIAYNNRGSAHMSLRNYLQALSDLNLAIDLDSSFAMAYRNRINLHVIMKNYELAEQDLQCLREIQPPDATIFSSIGTAYLFMGRSEEALQNFDQAIAADPTHAGSYHNRGCIYLHRNEIEKAGADFLKAQKLEPRDAIHGFMVEWYRLCFQGPDEKMIQRLQKYLEAGRNSSDIYLCSGIIYWLREQYEEALIAFEHALEIDWTANGATSYFWVGMACAALGRDDEAIAAFEQARKEGLQPCLFQTITLLEPKRPDFVASLRSEQPAP